MSVFITYKYIFITTTIYITETNKTFFVLILFNNVFYIHLLEYIYIIFIIYIYI